LGIGSLCGFIPLLIWRVAFDVFAETGGIGDCRASSGFIRGIPAKQLLNDNDAGKPEAAPRAPRSAIRLATDRCWHKRDGARLTMVVLHDDVQQEYAYGPARGLPDTKVGTFTQEL
jgi:hypothetical protein